MTIARLQSFPRESIPKIAIGILVILYIVGLVGVTVPLHEDFMLLTPINLLVTFFIALYAQNDLKPRLIWALLACYAIGFLMEWVGVQTGVLFGEYSYGATLGPKIFGTPLLIGLNWAMLVYAVVSLANRSFGADKILLKSIFGATLMLGLDILIEPVAVRYDFWSWSNTPYNSLFVAPFQNYLLWWVVAFALNLLFHKIAENTKNIAIEVLFCLQVFFFAWIYLIVK